MLFASINRGETQACGFLEDIEGQAFGFIPKSSPGGETFEAKRLGHIEKGRLLFAQAEIHSTVSSKT